MRLKNFIDELRITIPITIGTNYVKSKFQKFLPLILAVLIWNPDVGWGQDCNFNCGTPPLTDGLRNRIISVLSSQDGNRTDFCSDPIVNYGTKTYKLVLEYAVKSDGTQFPSASFIAGLKSYLNDKFAPHGINFIYFEAPISKCDNCDYSDQTWNGIPTPASAESTLYADCLYGRLGKYGNSNAAGTASIEKARFWAMCDDYQPLARHNVFHELGHALGLNHTFYSFGTSIHEFVVQNNDPCTCNCRFSGDLVCDTPTDPYIEGQGLTGPWNFAMFNESDRIIVNSNNKLDGCGTNYNTLDNDKVMSNVMSYHHKGWATGTSFLSSGQINLIKAWNNNRPWEVISSSASVPVQGTLEINTPTTFESEQAFSGNLIINSTLRINNTNVSFLNNAGITINNGGVLILDNSNLKKYESNTCMPNASYWQGITVNSPNKLSSIKLMNNSSITGVEKSAIVGENSKTTIEILNKSSISVNYGTNFYAINLKGGLGLVSLKSNSSIFGDIKIQNYFGSFNAFNSNILGDIDILNTSLNLKNSNFSLGSVFIRNSQLKTCLIEENIFNESMIFIEESKAPFEFKKNKIYYGQFTNNSNYDFSIGLNEFHRCSSSISIFPSIGNTNANLIFKNKINGSKIGVQVKNLSNKLQIECNDFKNISDAEAAMVIKDEIAPLQGTQDVSAANIFETSSPNVKNDIEKQTDYYWSSQAPLQKPNNITGTYPEKFVPNSITSNYTRCDLHYPDLAYPETCYDGIKNNGEMGVDCGGQCKPCTVMDDPADVSVAHCTDGVMNGGETGIDCGGTCTPCHICTDGVINGDETGVDCGGSHCPPCNTVSCNDGIQNNGETGIDCGGPCLPCFGIVSTCNDGIQNNGETGVDCGGACLPCSTFEIFNCYDGIQNNGETGVDCGGSCHPCNTEITNPPLPNQNYGTFVGEASTLYGANTIPPGGNISIGQDISNLNASYDGGNTQSVVSLIENYSQANPNMVVSQLIALSPAISPKVIHTLFKYSQYYTENQVASIIRLNPSLQYDEYVNGIIYKTKTFSSTVKTDIISAFSNSRSYHLNEIERINIKRGLSSVILRNNINMELSKSLPDYKYIREQFAGKDDPSRYYQIYETFIAEHKYIEAGYYLQSIDVNSITDPYYNSQLLQFKNVHNILLNNFYGGNKDVIMNSTIQNQLTTIANGCHGEATLKARTCLNEKLGTTWPDSTLICNRYSPLTFGQGTLPRLSDRVKASIYPNPASSEITIVIPEYNRGDQLSVKVFDIVGRAVFDLIISTDILTIDVNLWKSGVFTYVIDHNGQISQGKFVKID